LHKLAVVESLGFERLDLGIDQRGHGVSLGECLKKLSNGVTHWSQS
jgi:hypothetical protein